MQAIRLKTEHLIDPIGVDFTAPRLYWNCIGGRKQTAYQIVAADDNSGRVLWDSGRVESAAMCAKWGGAPVPPKTKVFWKVRLWDETDSVGDWTEATFETGINTWSAEWITGDYKVNKKERYPVDCFRKAFHAADVKKARLYITACGLYEAKLNGQRIGEFILAPGITDYRKRVQYQTYDVTALLQDGENALTVRVDLQRDGETVDTWEKRIGLRTMTMHIEKDRYGESFAHEVNGVTFFAMGADYIPEDNILPRTSPERTRKLLEQAVAANHNCVRVWGGGHYPSDAFYDACDELGLVIWQDFMFACAHYNLSDEFEENLRAEFNDNIKRIRSHASLGLWCGNNEMEMFTFFGGLALMPNNPTGRPPMWELTPKQKGNYTRLYEYILPKTVKALDPQTYYWPSSPSSGGDFDNPTDETRGDVHYWDVWHGSLPFTDYRNHNFRYVSEFGFQAFPTLKTVESFTEPEDRNIFSYVMEKHQRNNAANSKIMTYLGQTYRYPTEGLGTLLYTSQLLSAEAMKYGVEHWRRHRGQCMGAIVWQLNDCWPVASWSSIDYFGRWKALHYYEKRFFAPVLLSCEEKGFLDNPNPNRECRDLNTDTVKSIRLNVSNETMQPQTVTVKWELRNNRSEVLRDGGEVEITVPAMDTVWLDTVELPEANMFTDHVHYACYQNGEMISESTVLFSVPKYYDYIDPQLSCRVEGDEIIVSAKAYAKSVEVLNENEDWVLEDNYFDLEAGEERRIRIVSGEANGIHMRSVYNIR